jgi:hypothetical protein
MFRTRAVSRNKEKADIKLSANPRIHAEDYWRGDCDKDVRHAVQVYGKCLHNATGIV